MNNSLLPGNLENDLCDCNVCAGKRYVPYSTGLASFSDLFVSIFLYNYHLFCPNRHLVPEKSDELHDLQVLFIRRIFGSKMQRLLQVKRVAQFLLKMRYSPICACMYTKEPFYQEFKTFLFCLCTCKATQNMFDHVSFSSREVCKSCQ